MNSVNIISIPNHTRYSKSKSDALNKVGTQIELC
jgi:hypothetical protein